MLGMPAGRPSKYDPSYCDGLINHVQNVRPSLALFASKIGVARSTLNEWASQYPEFSEALSIAKTHCAAWWEEKGLDLVEEGGSGPQATMITFGLKNMSGDDWRDKQAVELSGPGGGAISVSVAGLTETQIEALASLKLEGE